MSFLLLLIVSAVKFVNMGYKRADTARLQRLAGKNSALATLASGRKWVMSYVNHNLRINVRT